MKLQDIGKLYWKDLLKEPETPKAWVVFWATVILLGAVLVSNVFGTAKIKMIRPFDDSVYPVIISGKYGAIREYQGGKSPHYALDYKLERGTTILASADGVVEFAGDSESGYGNLIIISHGNGIKTYYAHCLKIYPLEGAKIKQGDPIGQVGANGNARGYHLHFSVIVNGQWTHPATFIFNQV